MGTELKKLITEADNLFLSHYGWMGTKSSSNW